MATHYLRVMPLPRPASPRALWNDLRAFAAQRSRHQWLAALFAVIIPLGILFAFYLDAQTNIYPRRIIYYVDSWPADRSDADIKAKQEADIEAREKFEAERREQFQRLDNQLNRLGL